MHIYFFFNINNSHWHHIYILQYILFSGIRREDIYSSSYDFLQVFFSSFKFFFRYERYFNGSPDVFSIIQTSMSWMRCNFRFRNFHHLKILSVKWYLNLNFTYHNKKHVQNVNVQKMHKQLMEGEWDLKINTFINNLLKSSYFLYVNKFTKIEIKDRQ